MGSKKNNQQWTGENPDNHDPYSKILQSITDGILVIGRDKKIIFVNPVLANLYSYDSRDMIGKPCEELIGFDHCANCPFDLVIGGSDAFTGHNLRCDRISAGPHCVSVSPLRDETGRITGVVEIYRDMVALGAYIADIEEKNSELDYERQRLDTILTASSDGYFSVSGDRTVLSADDKLLALLGKGADQVVGHPCPDVFGSDKCETDCPLLWARDNNKAVIGCRERIVTADGILPVDKSIFLHTDPDGKVGHLIGMLRNASEIVELRKSARMATGVHRMVSRNARMEGVFGLIRTFGPTDAAVLILGESGTGKELVADALQETSPRMGKPFVKVNCSALAEGLLESEMFGHTKGAFTGADREKRGLFEVADGGSIFLDEVGDMSPRLQSKILRVLEQKEFEKVGGTQTQKVDIRVIAATNRDLPRAIAQGEFREDLYYRLNSVQLKIPPLRERLEDIPVLVDRFLDDMHRIHGRDVNRISARALDRLLRYSWPGNVRELRNAIEFAYLCSQGDRIERQDLPASILQADARMTPDDRSPIADSDDSRQNAIREAMRRNHGNREQVARDLGISRTTLWRRLKSMGM